MQDASAVQAVADLAVQATQSTQFSSPDTLPHALVLGGQVHNLEKLRQHRDRFRGTFSTRSLSAFVAYVAIRSMEAQVVTEGEGEGESPETGDGGDISDVMSFREGVRGPDSTTLFVDPETFTAVGIHNLGDLAAPGHCDDLAKLRLVQSAEWTALMQVNQKPLTQREMADWLQDWRGIFTPLYGDPGLITEALPRDTVSAAIQAVLHVKTEASQSASSKLQAHGAELSSFEALQMRSGDGLELPAGFRFSLHPYEDLKLRTVDAVLTVYPPTEGKAMRMSLRVTGLEALTKEMADEFQALLKERLDVPSFIGTFAP
jgi:uncharacterized protein YfdQ (DUF2303 family)